MKFQFTHQFWEAMKPGQRVWAAAFKISSTARKVVKDMPPTLVEITCGSVESREADMRQAGKRADRVTPIGKNGRPDFSRSVDSWEVHFCETREDAVLAYADDLDMALLAIKASNSVTTELARRINAKRNELGLPYTPKPPSLSVQTPIGEITAVSRPKLDDPGLELNLPGENAPTLSLKYDPDNKQVKILLNGEPVTQKKTPGPDAAESRNTLISFMYRDGANYKTHNEICIRGEITEEQIDRIMASLDDGVYFIPEKVGLEAERWVEYNEQFDHLWCELDRDSFSLTNRKYQLDLSPEELTSRFQRMAGAWEQDNSGFDWIIQTPI